ncbi:hypothetical protein ABAC460_16775 [Asticcacaulis sp. AC460]|uniref:hypothetical protein n=1 Tax=Asticcacaulis sp. AC460 TaxID=1282360 RepID=UPI0003C3D802|nr:hypothetical protein [Asticcacaulis sp. AC460]ESQ88314.1 hypothetical protein ABAC460_16775 [Asticcacaulis sp. AC460]
MSNVSGFRLYLLRAIYLLITVAQGLNIWPLILHHDKAWGMNEGVVICMMGALTALSAFGLRYPLLMLPLLLWEIVWKTIWLIVVAIPLWLSGAMDKATAETAFACGLVVIIYAAVPWGYVVSHYITRSGDPWGWKTLPSANKA